MGVVPGAPVAIILCFLALATLAVRGQVASSSARAAWNARDNDLQQPEALSCGLSAGDLRRRSARSSATMLQGLGGRGQPGR